MTLPRLASWLFRLIAVVSALATWPGDALARGLQPIDCPSRFTGLQNIQCANFRVPQNWDQPGGPPIDIFVLVLRATGKIRAPDPVLVISGGPGQASSGDAPDQAVQLAPLRRTRDLLFVDLRGTGRSVPALTCTAISPVQIWHGRVTATEVSDCLDPIRVQGFDLAAFNSSESARDLVSLRQELQYPLWNLLATSYGAIPRAIG
jgi:pimeloyl-ACP methyl ester carboxylesterase